MTLPLLSPIIVVISAGVIIIKGILDTVWGVYVHSNIDVRSGALQYVINDPEMHRWHHAKENTEGGNRLNPDSRTTQKII